MLSLHLFCSDTHIHKEMGMSVHLQVYLQHAHGGYGWSMHAARSRKHSMYKSTAKQVGHKVCAVI